MSLIQRLVIPLLLVGVVGLGTGGYFFYQYQQSQKELEILKKSSPQATQNEVNQIVAEVSKLMELPKDEQPTLATVSDISKLKDQPFFQKARNGDKVLIYTNAKKAILFDPNAKKIIDVAPINIGSNSAQVTKKSDVQKPETIKIVLRNGTKLVGLTTKYESQILKALPEAKVVKKENAADTSYDRSIVVALNDFVKTEAEDLAKDLKMNVESIPAGESTPKEADILIILGKDKR